MIKFINVKLSNPRPRMNLTARQKEALAAWAFIGAGFILFAVFMLYPLIKNFMMSFMHYSLNPRKPSYFIGLDNFKMAFLPGGLLGESERFYLSLRNTFLAVLVTVPFQWAIGIMLALAIEGLRRFKMLYRFLLYIPVISDWLVVAIIFRYIFQPTSGSLVNALLLKLNLINQPISWFESALTANIVIWSLCIWKGIGWVMIMYTAALQDLPKGLYEAARVDGANVWVTFTKITIPLLSSRTYFILVSLIIGAFNILLQVMLITNGAPLGQTDVLLNYMYNKAFTSFDFGYAAAISMVIGSILVTISVFQKKIMKYTEIEY